MFKAIIVAAILALTAAAPEPKAAPKPGFLAAAYSAPLVTSAPLAYSAYSAPLAYSGYGYGYGYAPYAAGYSAYSAYSPYYY